MDDSVSTSHLLRKNASAFDFSGHGKNWEKPDFSKRINSFSKWRKWEALKLNDV